LISERAVGSNLIVIDSPILDLPPSIIEVREPVLVETFFPDTAVEALQKRILSRLPGLDEMKLDVILVRPDIQRTTGKFRAIIADQNLGETAGLLQAIQDPDNPSFRRAPSILPRSRPRSAGCSAKMRLSR
jgi:hypothetical protein